MPRKGTRSAERLQARGFTLIEVMVAVAILGIALTIIMELFSGGLRLARKSEDYSRAVFYGRQLLEELCLRKKLSEKTESGKFEGDYQWKYEVEPVPMVGDDEEEEKYPLEVFKIKVQVLWTRGNREKHINLETTKAIVKEEEKKPS